MKHTFKERLIAGVKAAGYQPVDTASSRYEAFAHPKYPSKLFIGSMGALRAGALATKSHSVGDPTHQTKEYLRFLELGDKAILNAKYGKLGTSA